MSLDTLFRVCNLGVLPFWLLLALAPRARLTALLVHRPLVPILLGTLYGVLIFTGSPPPADGNMGSLAGVTALFSAPQVLTAGWIHYLIFDLFVGAWETRDAARRAVPHLLVVPCLGLTLMLGPLGLLAYLGVRYARTRVLDLDETLPSNTGGSAAQTSTAV
ncbi:MAG TPA: ABA4-like family protein [Polyangiales bacterium]